MRNHENRTLNHGFDCPSPTRWLPQEGNRFAERGRGIRGIREGNEGEVFISFCFFILLWPVASLASTNGWAAKMGPSRGPRGPGKYRVEVGFGRCQNEAKMAGLGARGED